jgi:hypothetical protein
MKRVARLNAESEWIRQEVAHLRIIDDALWAAVKDRQQGIRKRLTIDRCGIRSERALRPTYLLSGLLRCGVCEGGFSKVSEQHYGCFNARNRGNCGNRLTIRRDVIEASVLSGLKTHLMDPEVVKEFVAEWHRELNRLSASREHEHADQKVELARIERQIRAIIEAVKEGLRTASMKDELLALETRKAEPSAVVQQESAVVPRLHPILPRSTVRRSRGLRRS